MNVHLIFRRLRSLVTVISLVTAAACASAGRGVPPGTVQPDKFLFDKGTEALTNKKWLTSREYAESLSARCEARIG
jgi:hypothetical protein